MAQNTKYTGYRVDLKSPLDSEAKRNKAVRWVASLLSIAVLLALPTAFLAYWGVLLGNATAGTVMGLIGFGIGGELVARIAPNRMFVYNPEWTGYVSQDALTGGMVIYGPGLHPSLWWEARNKKGNWSLKVITRDFGPGIATADAKVTIRGKYEYAMNLALLDRAIGVDESTIDSGITAFINSFLISECAQDTAENVRGRIDDLNQKLAAEFMRAATDNPKTREDETTIAKLGEKYGFITVAAVIESIELPEAAQKTRNAKDEAVQLFEVVAQMYGLDPAELRRRVAAKEITTDEYNKMLNRAMAASENATTMTVSIIEGDAGAALAGAATRMVKGGAS